MTLNVKSHIPRDILQSAGLFKSPEAAVWEYVSNSLQYVDPGIIPTVHVHIGTDDTITIEDNGRGMPIEGPKGLEHYFTMHGENRERRAGHPGRGIYGTGKSAAFGIGTSLTVDTVHNGIRNVVRLDRTAINNAPSDTVPVAFLTRSQQVPGTPTGTKVIIGGVKAKVTRDAVARFIERHLAVFRSLAPVVTVNGRVCEIAQPTIIDTHTFRSTDAQRQLLGDIELTVNVSAIPLDDANRGIAVYTGPQSLVAFEAAGVDTKDYGDRLFGEVTVPNLDDPRHEPLVAYSAGRDMKLHAAHPVAGSLIGFIGSSLEQVRRRLAKEAREAKRTEEMRRLAKTGNEIAAILNADMAAQAHRIEEMANVHQRTRIAAQAAGSEHDETTFTPSPTGTHTGTVSGITGAHEIGEEPTVPTPESERDTGGTPGGDLSSPSATADPTGPEPITPVGSTGKKKPRGGLSVEWDHLGADFGRSLWEENRKVIIINFDHPVIAAAQRNDGPDGLAFRRLSYEVAFTQYAMAMADMQSKRDPSMGAAGALFEARTALDRVWATAEPLYR